MSTAAEETTTNKAPMPIKLGDGKGDVQLPWVEKYRPKTLDDLVAHQDIISIIQNLIDSDNLPHLLLYGPPGTGKVRLLYHMTLHGIVGRWCLDELEWQIKSICLY
jgi:hypothetical protein